MTRAGGWRRAGRADDGAELGAARRRLPGHRPAVGCSRPTAGPSASRRAPGGLGRHGLWPAMIDAGLWLHGSRLVVDGAGSEDGAGLEGRALPAHAGPAAVRDGAYLGEHLGRHGVEVERSTALLALSRTTTASRAPAHATAAWRRRAFVYRRLRRRPQHGSQGCWGSGSRARPIPVEFMLGDVAVDWDLPARRRCAPCAREMARWPTSWWRSRCPKRDVTASRCSPPRSSPMAPAAAAWRTASRRSVRHRHWAICRRRRTGLAGHRLSDMRWSSIFRISMRLADSYRPWSRLPRRRRRAHPPTDRRAGHEHRHPGRLQSGLEAGPGRSAGEPRQACWTSYEAERRPVGQDVLERTHAETEAFRRGRASRGGRATRDWRMPSLR